MKPCLIAGAIVGILLAARCGATPPEEAKDTKDTKHTKDTADARSPHPTVVVSFERDTLRENDILPVRIYMVNDTDALLTTVRLTVALPEAVAWTDGQQRVSGNAAKRSPILLSLPAMKPYTTLTSALSIQTPAAVQMGDYSLPFALSYDWQTPARLARAGSAPNPAKHGGSMVVVEKTLKVRFFGSDSIAGIPLGLAGLIVPGLMFWMALGWAKVPWSKDLALGDKLIYSVISSILLLLVFRLLSLVGPNSSISLDLLARLGGVGLLCGAVITGVDRAARNIACERRETLAAELTVSEQEDIYTLLDKMVRASDLEKRLDPGVLATLLHLSKVSKNPQTRVEVTQNATTEVYLGSLCATSDSTVWLIGWYEVAAGPDQEQASAAARAEIGRLLKKHRIRRAIDVARRSRIPIRERDSILQQTGSDRAPTDEYLKRWPQDQVTVHQIEDAKLPELLSMV